MKSNKILGSLKDKTSKIDVVILFLTVAVIAVGISPQL